MKKLLVTGASGFLGWNICQSMKKKWEITGVVFSHKKKISKIRTVHSDLTRFKTVKKIFQDIRPDAVIHTAANADPNYCQIHPSETKTINVNAALHIAGLSADNKIPCVFTSTDLVFNGLNAPYSEDSPVSPLSLYGEQKVLAENGMMKRYPLVTICRMPLMFGPPGNESRSFIQPMIQKMRDAVDVRLFTDEWRSPISARAAVQGIFLTLEQHVRGVIHLGGKERISRYDFGLLVKKIFSLHNAVILPSHQQDVDMAAPRPHDVSFSSLKAFALGFNPLSLEDELSALKRSLKSI